MHGSMFCIAGVTAKISSLEGDDVSLRVDSYTAEGVSVLLQNGQPRSFFSRCSLRSQIFS
jgi:hypothetical protein